MQQVNKNRFFNLTRQSDYVVLNIILSFLYLIPIYIAFVILISTLEDTIKFLLILALALTLLIVRFSFSIIFGFKWEQEHKKMTKNYILEFFILAGALDLLLTFYYAFYFQINDIISAEIISIILGPIVIIAVGSLLMSGIENVLYSFIFGLISLALFVDPLNIHHTMGEFVIMYSFGSTLILSPFYVLPSIFVGKISDKLNNQFFNTKRTLKILLLTTIPLLLITIAHISFYYLAFRMW